MNRRLLHVGIVLILAPAALQAQSDLRGLATIGRAAEFPPDGLYAASNAFPLNSLIDVTDPATGRSVRVLVVSVLADPGMFVLLSPNAAERLGLPAGATPSVRAREVFLPGLTAVDPNLDLPFHADPDINPVASLGDPNRAIIAPGSGVAAVEPQPVPQSAVEPQPVPQSPVNERERPIPIPLRPRNELDDPAPLRDTPIAPRVVQPPVEIDERTPTTPDAPFVAPDAPDDGAALIATLREPTPPEPLPGRASTDAVVSAPIKRAVLPDPLAERLAAAQELREAQNVALAPLVGERPETLPSAGVQARSAMGLDLPPFEDDLQPLELNERLAGPGDLPRIAVDLPTPGDHTLPDVSYPRPTPPEEPLRVALPVIDPADSSIEASDTLRSAVAVTDEQDHTAPLAGVDIDLAKTEEQVPIESGELVPSRRDERIVTLEPAEFRAPPVPLGASDDLAPNRANLRATDDPLVAIIAPEPREPDLTAIDVAQPPLTPERVPPTAPSVVLQDPSVSATVDEPPLPPGRIPPAAPPVALRDPSVPAVTDARPQTQPVAPRIEPAPTPESVPDLEPEPAPEPESAPTLDPETAPRVTLIPEAVREPAVVEPAPAVVAQRDPDHLWAADNLPLVSDLNRSSVYLQVAALNDPRSAKRAVDGLGSSLPVAVLAQPRNGADIYRVLVGPLAEDEKGSVLVAVRGRGFRDAFVRNAP